MAASIERSPVQPSAVQPASRPPLNLAISRPSLVAPGTLLKGPASYDAATFVTANLLDRAHETLRHGTSDEVGAGMYDLLSGLYAVKSAAAEADVWQRVVGQCLAHPVRDLIHEDPFTGRSFGKPRGYAGDAVMIDYIYSRTCRLSEAEHVSPVGEAIFAFNRDTPACRAVRTRRDLVTGAIDEVCERVSRPRILSVACGHLREATLARGVTAGRVGRFVALDQDELSLRVVEQETAGLGVVPVCSSIKALFRGAMAAERFDFVYTTGLYDYLDDRLATKLTQRMFEMLNPGGRLLIANFVPEIWGRGYMETFMGWDLIYRDADDMRGLMSPIEPEQIGSMRTFVEENENIVFLDVTRA